MKIKRTVYHKEGYNKVGQEAEIELTADEMKQTHDEYEYLWKGMGSKDGEKKDV